VKTKDPETRRKTGSPTRSKKPFPWKKIVLAVVTTVVFFGLLEAILAVFGVKPEMRRGDPFVGFASNVPLFALETAPDGNEYLVTAANKRHIFNLQRFPERKPPESYRIFCLGGSTTYGRPYDDTTSFAGWLRVLLPVADPSRRWEVINAGGISYASYRVAALMEELARYEPDLFVVYTGHNEFLEERTYGSLRELPRPVVLTAAILARTRTWTMMSHLLAGGRGLSRGAGSSRFVLPEEVNARLDSSAGLDLYERDDALRDRILRHYRVSLERMVEIADSTGAGIIFVTPASNLKDFSPFKSQHTDDSAENRELSEQLVARIDEQTADGRWQQALRSLDEALAVDARHAELHYRRGRALLELERFEEAKAAFVRARDEDVCPLRALTPVRDIASEVAKETGTPLVDFVEVLERRQQSELGHTVSGQEYFLDHVHPTIEGNRILALALIREMIDRGTVHPIGAWGEDAIAEVATRVEGGLDRQAHALALGKLALVLDWAGKYEDSRRLALQAFDSGLEDPQVLAMIARRYAREGIGAEALAYYLRASRAAPLNPIYHFYIGVLLEGRQQLEKAAAHLFMAGVLRRDDEQAHRHLGFVMSQRGRYRVALSSYRKAQRLNPQSDRIKQRIAWLQEQLGPDARADAPSEVSSTTFPSGNPGTVAQVSLADNGQYRPDGILTEWYESGTLKRFAEFVEGTLHGIDVTWDEEGRIESRVEYRNGRRTGDVGDDSS
jgi:tetratricopeptide (TPR) repeat protein